jgi:phosphoenolpyruvate carboxylase
MTDPIDTTNLSTYEIAELLETIAESSTKLAERIGKSRTYVGKMRTAWRYACPSLKKAWQADELSYDMVKRIATIGSKTEQAKALAAYLKAIKGRTRVARGEARREIIEAKKEGAV